MGLVLLNEFGSLASELGTARFLLDPTSNIIFANFRNMF